jgi:peptide/nickel transport system permease protein
MGAFVLRRLGQTVPVLLGVSILAFLLLNALPGNVAIAVLGTNATPSSIKIVDQQLHLNRSLVDRYVDWLWAALHGNLGTSFISHASVLHSVAARVPVTLELVVGALLVALVLAIPTALVSVRWPGGILDRIFTLITILGLSVPNFIVALVLVLVAAVKFHLFPTSGFVPLSQSITGNLKSVALPVLSMSFIFFGTYARLLKADMAQQLDSEEYVLLAKAKGRGEWSILVRHVFKNSSFGLIVVAGTNFGQLVGTTVVLETIFALPGIGQLLITSIGNRDAPTVQGIVLILGIVVVLANLLSDIVYSSIDPRVRYGRADS